MRITMGMITKQYSKNLNDSLSQLNTANSQATTFRKFDKTSEDPFSAAKAYRLRREGTENDTYQSNLEDVSSQLMTAQSAMMSIHDIVSEASTGDTIQAITGTMSADDRATVATKLRALQQAILAPANTKFGDKYLFGGSEMSQPPFSVGANGNLLYRGIDVNTGKIEAGTTTTMNGATIQFGKNAGATSTTFNGSTIKIGSGTDGSVTVDDSNASNIVITVNLPSDATNQDFIKALNNAKGTAPNGTAYDFTNMTMTGDLNRPVATTGADAVSEAAYDNITRNGSVSVQEALTNLAGEQSLVDLGMGLKLKADGSVDTQSVFDAAIPGISFLGYGTVDGTATGISNNLYSLAGQIADQLESSDFSIDKIQPYLDNFSKQGQNLMAKITESGTKSNFLTARKTNLESMGDAIVEKDQDTEFMDPADAIMNAQMQQYSYNAALQMGTRIMTKTIFDFMA